MSDAPLGLPGPLLRPRLQGLVRALWWVALVASIASCAEPSERGGRSDDRPGEVFFPLVEGARWTYEISGLGPAPVELAVVARGLRTVRGLKQPVFVMDEITDGEELGFAVVAPVGYVRVGEYLGRLLALDYDGDELHMLGGEKPVRFLPLRASPSLEWEDRSTLFEFAQAEGAARYWKHRASWVAELEVAAGTFRDVLRIESRYFDSPPEAQPRASERAARTASAVPGTEPGPEASPESMLRFEDFYARGVGLVRTVTYDEQRGGEATLEGELIRFSIPGAGAASGPASP